MEKFEFECPHCDSIFEITSQEVDEPEYCVFCGENMSDPPDAAAKWETGFEDDGDY